MKSILSRARFSTTLSSGTIGTVILCVPGRSCGVITERAVLCSWTASSREEISFPNPPDDSHTSILNLVGEVALTPKTGDVDRVGLDRHDAVGTVVQSVARERTNVSTAVNDRVSGADPVLSAVVGW